MVEPESPDFLFALGDHYLRRGMPAQALAVANRLTSIAPTDPQGQQLKVAAEQAIGR